MYNYHYKFETMRTSLMYQYVIIILSIINLQFSDSIHLYYSQPIHQTDWLSDIIIILAHGSKFNIHTIIQDISAYQEWGLDPYHQSAVSLDYLSIAQLGGRSVDVRISLYTVRCCCVDYSRFIHSEITTYIRVFVYTAFGSTGSRSYELCSLVVISI